MRKRHSDCLDDVAMKARRLGQKSSDTSEKGTRRVVVRLAIHDKNKQASMESGGPLFAYLGSPFLPNTSIRPTRHLVIDQHKNIHAINQPRSKTTNHNINPGLSIRPTGQSSTHNGANLSLLSRRVVKKSICPTGSSIDMNSPWDHDKKVKNNCNFLIKTYILCNARTAKH